MILLRGKRERWFVLKDCEATQTGGGEYEVTVTSELHAQAERTKKQNRLHSMGAKTKTQAQRMVTDHGGVTNETGIDRDR